MDRKTFIKTGCIACTSMTLMTALIQSCVSVKYANGKLVQDGITIPVEDFEHSKKGHRSYVIVRHEDLQFPICVYRLDDNNYSALLMRCSHQGAELTVSGDMLTCAAHGSEFDKTGKVIQSPASENLRSFPVSVTDNQIFIDLRKQA